MPLRASNTNKALISGSHPACRSTYHSPYTSLPFTVRSTSRQDPLEACASGDRAAHSQSICKGPSPARRSNRSCCFFNGVTQRLAPQAHRQTTSTAALQGICFDRACQEAQDQIFLVVLAVPLLCLAAAIAYNFLRKPPAEVNMNLTR